MSIRDRLRPYVPSQLRRLPGDLAASLVLLAVTAAVVSLPVIRETWIRAVVSLPFLLFVPGYAFVSALFPESPRADRDPMSTPRRHPTDLERLTLSLGSSIALVPIVAYVLDFLGQGFRVVPMLVALGLFTVVCVVLAASRRFDLPPARRFSAPTGDWYRSIREDFLSRETRGESALNVLLAVALLLATASVGYAAVDNPSGEQYTELYLLTRADDGTLVTDDYPTELTATESRSLVVGVRNHEHERTRYTVLVRLQRLQSDGEGMAVTEEERLDRFEVTLASNGSVERPRVVTPTLVGDRLRLQFLLYRGDVPADPSAANAYRRAHLWVNVTTAN
ncbi:Uncharacterized membrane protein [Halogeometricum rufum]|uniref:Uncharacterized membrane protein n=1 Tax=Halogeometricum rufum TaxID=553469 RepID=A0A1I6J4V2_9EURY|nr:DUF1616 domain-containing protein [Halogeometricum rufum]SFR73969.1 Uncharacterized membrane protein [Halogeometricum rufum]